MGARHRGKRIRRKDAAAIVDAEAELLAAFALAAGCDREAAEDLAVGALDALWRRRTDFGDPTKRRCFLLHAMTSRPGFAASAPAVALLRMRAGLTASQAGYVLDATVARIESFGECQLPEVELDRETLRRLRRRALIRAGRLLLPVRLLVIAGIAMVWLAACVLALAAARWFNAEQGGPASRPAEPPAATRPGPDGPT